MRAESKHDSVDEFSRQQLESFKDESQIILGEVLDCFEKEEEKLSREQILGRLLVEGGGRLYTESIHEVLDEVQGVTTQKRGAA